MHLKIRVPVNGGAGFLGRHRCGLLLKDGANIICVGNYYIGTRRNSEDLFEEFLRDELVQPSPYPMNWGRTMTEHPHVLVSNRCSLHRCRV